MDGGKEEQTKGAMEGDVGVQRYVGNNLLGF